MKRSKHHLLALIMAIPALAGMSGSARAADADAEALQAYLHAPYFEVEFFVFERPSVQEFSSDEILTLNRYRALPRTFRLQSAAEGEFWPASIDPLTRACLTFPTLTYELLPPTNEFSPAENLPGSGNPTGSSEAEVELATSDAEDPASLADPQPVPLIHPAISPDPELDFLAAMAEYERSLQDASNRWLPVNQLQLTREAARIERRGLGRILFHGRWLQAIPDRENPLPVLVVGGETLNIFTAGSTATRSTATPELMGTVGVTLGRYLHFNADLYFHAPGLGLMPASAALDPDGTPLIRATAPVEHGYMRLSQSRRMRSTELHYLDHPKLGLVVRIDPLIFPEPLVQQFQRLKTLEEDGQ